MYLRCTLTDTFLALTTLPPNTTETVPDTTDASVGDNITESRNDKFFDVMGVEGITLHMGGYLLTVQSMEMMSYFLFFWPLFSAI